MKKTVVRTKRLMILAMMKVHDNVQETVVKNIAKKKKHNKAKWLS